MTKLGVNIDHIATLRQARRGTEPDPLEAARICQDCGADSLVCHLREDRRHMQDKDIYALKRHLKIPLNLEMSLNAGIIDITADVCPHTATIVPERRAEITTEGGLDVVRYHRRIQKAITRLRAEGITVSLFIDPLKKQIRAAADAGATVIELHTGRYADSRTASAKKKRLHILAHMAAYARTRGLTVSAGHGLKYHDTRPVARIPDITELNIGHTIIARAVVTGLGPAVKDMKDLCRERR